ncbi:MAG: hypothetical protein K2X00_15260 [Nitrospiraceae bacterium]|nr:hypothetical protein [Nitrospiraceae bacterium]OQW63560.1 MAG: hypothetical protein BVN29_15540 [Nitrospira sp. ST-bin5]
MAASNGPAIGTTRRTIEQVGTTDSTSRSSLALLRHRLDENIMMTLSRAAWLYRVLVLVLGLVLFGPTGIYADQAQYIYDDLGRLSQVIDGQGNVAT